MESCGCKLRSLTLPTFLHFVGCTILLARDKRAGTTLGLFSCSLASLPPPLSPPIPSQHNSPHITHHHSHEAATPQNTRATNVLAQLNIYLTSQSHALASLPPPLSPPIPSQHLDNSTHITRLQQQCHKLVGRKCSTHLIHRRNHTTIV